MATTKRSSDCFEQDNMLLLFNSIMENGLEQSIVSSSNPFSIENEYIKSIGKLTYTLHIFHRIVTEKPNDCQKISLSNQGARGKTNVSMALQVRHIPTKTLVAMINSAPKAIIQKQYISNATYHCSGNALIDAVKFRTNDTEVIQALIKKGGKQMLFFQDQNGRNAIDHMVHVHYHPNGLVRPSLAYMIFRAAEAGMPFDGIDEPFESLTVNHLPDKISGLYDLINRFPLIISMTDIDTKFQLYELVATSEDSDLSTLFVTNKLRLRLF